MKIAYVCTNYNNSAFTLAAVESLMKNAGHDIRIYVVDNASRQEEVDILRTLAQRVPEVRLMANTDNVGYFAGLNMGIRAAREEDASVEWMVVGNNDLVFPDDICDRIEQRRAEYGDYPVVSPDVVTLDGHHQNPHVLTGISTARELVYDLYFSNYYLGRFIYRAAKAFPRVTRRGDEDHWRTARTIRQGHGSCYVLTPKFFAKFEDLWSPTFMMSEEFFLSLQLERAGEHLFYSPDISVTHYWHGSLQDVPNRRRWNIARDAHREYRKYVKVFKNDKNDKNDEKGEATST